MVPGQWAGSAGEGWSPPETNTPLWGPAASPAHRPQLELRPLCARGQCAARPHKRRPHPCPGQRCWGHRPCGVDGGGRPEAGGRRGFQPRGSGGSSVRVHARPRDTASASVRASPSRDSERSRQRGPSSVALRGPLPAASPFPLSRGPLLSVCLLRGMSFPGQGSMGTTRARMSAGSSPNSTMATGALDRVGVHIFACPARPLGPLRRCSVGFQEEGRQGLGSPGSQEQTQEGPAHRALEHGLRAHGLPRADRQ